MTKYNTNLNFLASEVKKQLDILEVAQNEGLHLKKQGINYFASCPFHSERTESFSINPKKQIYKCFGCGEGGDVISLLSSLQGISPGKIIYRYAKDFGLINDKKPSRKREKEIQLHAIKYEFKKKEESNFDVVYRFLCDKTHAFRRSMKEAKTMREVKAMQHFYNIYNLLPYYEYLLDCMLGEYGEIPQVEAYLEAEGVMEKWHNSQMNN